MGNKEVMSNENLKDLAEDVLQQYDIIPEKMSIIQSGSIKTVWKVIADNHVFCLKRLKQPYKKALFSVNAQIHVQSSGGNVPKIILSRNEKPLVEHNNQIFVLYEWLEGSDLNFQSQEDLVPAIQGLAKFHVFSKGYVSLEDAEISSKLAKWPKQYESMKNRFITWKEEAKNHAEAHYATYLKHVDSMVELADLAVDMLEKTNYKEFVSQGSNSIVLCHQDYGKGNALKTENGVYVLDLDGVTYDLPARDLRKIIGKYSENKGKWQSDIIENVLEWYTKVNPMSDAEKQVLYVDLMFPHWFFGLVKNLFQNNKQLKMQEIERITQLEKSKSKLLKSLITGGE